MTMSMEGCDIHRERLGEFLVGALDAEASAAVEEHLGECRCCGAELADIQRLEGILWSIEPARPKTRIRTWAFTAAAAAVTFAAVAIFLAAPRPPRLIEGELSGFPPASARPSIPYGRGIAGVRPSLIELPGGSIVEPMADARFVLEGPRKVKLDLGEAFFQVRDGRDGFEVQTPRGTVKVLGTSFLVQVKEEPVMSGGTILKAGGAAVVSVAVVTGTVLWVASDGSSARIEAGKSARARDGVLKLLETEAEVERLRAERKAAVEEKEKLAARSLELEKEVASLASEVAELRAEAAGDAEDAAREPLAVAFGDWGELEEIACADWREMGEAAENVMKLVDELVESGKAIEEAPPDLLLGLGTENQKLFPFALEIAGKLPTHAVHGEFTHPIAHWNLLSERLRFAGVPLSKRQLRSIARLGDQYEEEWERLQAAYSDDTLKLQKVIDELDIKRRYLDRVEALLSREQRLIVAKEEVHHVHKLDVHSPMIIVAALARPVTGESREKLRDQAIDQWAAAWGIDIGKVASRPDLIDGWLSALEPRLAPVSRVEAARFRIDDALAAGRAQVALMGQILDAGLADETSASKMRSETLFLVPRLLAGG